MDEEKIIDNWITKQKGLFITDNTLICPCCKKPKTRAVLTKESGLCMPCFILNIVMACKKSQMSAKDKLKQINQAYDNQDFMGKLVYSCDIQGFNTKMIMLLDVKELIKKRERLGVTTKTK